ILHLDERRQNAVCLPLQEIGPPPETLLLRHPRAMDFGNALELVDRLTFHGLPPRRRECVGSCPRTVRGTCLNAQATRWLCHRFYRQLEHIMAVGAIAEARAAHRREQHHVSSEVERGHSESTSCPGDGSWRLR